MVFWILVLIAAVVLLLALVGHLRGRRREAAARDATPGRSRRRE